MILPVADCIAQMAAFDAILDARSPSEYAIDHLPGAISTPVLDDSQRARIGTLYKQSAFEAKRVGAALVARNIADIVDRLPAGLSREWRPLVYCWRGGNRSGALGLVLARIGFRVTLVDGGYREFRRLVVDELARASGRFRFRVLAGRTGSGKTLLLQHLAAAGAQVLDLERLAAHRGSVLGGLPSAPQPAQKRFETLIWDSLRRFDPGRPVYVESESKKIGQNHVPDALLVAIRSAECLQLHTPDAIRVALLADDYRHFIESPHQLAAQLDCLIGLHGRDRVGAWQALASAGRWPDFIEAVLHEHYDPAYDRSMRRNFERLANATRFDLAGGTPQDFDVLAGAILASENRMAEPAAQAPTA